MLFPSPSPSLEERAGRGGPLAPRPMIQWAAETRTPSPARWRQPATKIRAAAHIELLERRADVLQLGLQTCQISQRLGIDGGRAGHIRRQQALQNADNIGTLARNPACRRGSGLIRVAIQHA